jgi:CRP-like cAMP-binding protein
MFVPKYSMLDTLINTLSKTITLTSQDVELCKSYFEPLTVYKNNIVEEQGKTPEYLYFIARGYMRLFYYDNNGDEATTYFGIPGTFIASFLSFIHAKQASENVECITDCELVRIARPNLVKLIDESESFKKLSLTIFEQAIATTEKRANNLATLNAEQRYKKFIEEQPLLLQNIPVQYIASYLGMKPESLSRIRRQIIS